MSYSIIKNFPLDDVFHIIKTNKTIQMVIDNSYSHFLL